MTPIAIRLFENKVYGSTYGQGLRRSAVFNATAEVTEPYAKYLLDFESSAAWVNHARTDEQLAICRRRWKGLALNHQRRIAVRSEINTMYTSSSYEELLMESTVLTVRVDNKTKTKLDKLAEVTKRSKSFLAAEAIERYLEVEAWQIKETKQAIKEADAGDFVSDAEFAKIVRKYAG